MFQSYALWPHMTVRKNIGYPLKARKLKGPETKNWVEETAALVDCSTLLDRYPAQLSGGQQQRVALARGLVARPDVVLFDEPLSNLDARLRDQVRAQLHELHDRLRFSAVFVTHDQSEALALADRVAIMRAGRFEQIGTPEHVFEEPGHRVRRRVHRHVEPPAAGAQRGRLGRSPVRRVSGSLHAAGQPVARSPCASDPRICTSRRRPPTCRRLHVLRRHARSTSQFGGRHMDVVIEVGGTRLDARVPSTAFGGWARKLELDQPVVAGFDPRSAVYYGDDDTRLAGHVDLAAPVAVGV